MPVVQSFKNPAAPAQTTQLSAQNSAAPAAQPAQASQPIQQATAIPTASQAPARAIPAPQPHIVRPTPIGAQPQVQPTPIQLATAQTLPLEEPAATRGMATNAQQQRPKPLPATRNRNKTTWQKVPFVVKLLGGVFLLLALIFIAVLLVPGPETQTVLTTVDLR